MSAPHAKGPHVTISEVIIQVGDVDDAVAFYVEVCGFEHVRTVEHEGESVAELDAGGQRVSLVPAASPGVLLALDTPDIAATRRRLKRSQTPLDADRPETVAGGRWLPFRDPWGNHLGWWQAGPGE